MHWFLDPIQKHYADFAGRVGRQEFWMFVLFSCGLQVFLEFLDIDIIITIAAFGLFFPSIALGARRLHDTDKSGWWQLLWLIPIIGWIILILFFAQKTALVDNRYGVPASPKAVSVVASIDSTPTTNEQATVHDVEDVSDKTS